MHTKSLALAVVLVVMLAGCAPVAAPGTEPTPTPSETTAVSPEPTTDPSDPSTWVIGFGSLGPLRVGGTVGEVAGDLAAFTVEVQEACPWLTILTSADYGTIAVPTGDDDVIDQLVVWDASSALGTAAGIAMGSSEADVLAAYPDAVAAEGPYGPEYSATDGSGYFINFSLGQSGSVESIVTRDSPNIDGEYCG